VSRGRVAQIINNTNFGEINNLLSQGRDMNYIAKLCHCAYESLLEFLRTTIGLSDGVPGMVMTIHTFGDYMEKFHPHLHTMVSDGLFRKSGTFYVMPKVDLEPLEEIFRAKVLKMLKAGGKMAMRLSIIL